MTYREMTSVPTHVTYLAKANTPTHQMPTDIKWSNTTMPVPPIGELVHVAINSIGAARVEKYFVEHGFLGLLVKPLAPPAWYVAQNGRTATCHVYGAEIDPLKPDPDGRRAIARVVRVRGLDGDGFPKKRADRFVVKVYSYVGHRMLLDGTEARTTPERALNLAERFCRKNGLVMFATEVPS
jgi:hypothetical protein